MSEKRDVHLVPRPNGGALDKSGSQRASKVIETQKEPIASGRKIAEREKFELVIHGEDGKLREKNSYGNDPYPPKG